MSSSPELNEFLDQLGERRRRLVALVEPSGPRSTDLLEELNELSEQLIVADEELRVQQEELEGTRRALLSLSEERDLLLHDVPRALLITDGRGVVVQATRVARQLIRQPLARHVPRPIATWFEVADRGVVRSMISQLIATDVAQEALISGRGVVDIVAQRGLLSRERIDAILTSIALPVGGRP